MRKIAKFIGGLALATTLFSPKAKAQYSQVLDPLLYSQYHNTIDSNKAGLSNIFYIIDNDTLVTDSLGKVELYKTMNMHVNQGWNLLSLNLKPIDPRANALFPDASSRAFSYNGTNYIMKDTLDPLKAYWIKFNSPQDVPIKGRTITKRELELTDGWNMVGSLSESIPISSVQDTGNIRSSDFFEYVNGYRKAISLDPGKGYWVKASKPGSLFLNTGEAFLEKNLRGKTLEDKFDNENPPSPPSEDVINEISKNIKTNLQVYQNNLGNLNFHLNLKGNALLKIYDVLGREVQSFNLNGQGETDLNFNLNSLDGRRLSSGTYCFMLSNYGEINVGKFSNVNGKVFLGRKYLKEVSEPKVLTFRERFSQKGSMMHKRSLDNLVNGVRVQIRDELTDSVGNYHDFESTFVSLDDIPDKIALFPSDTLLNDKHPCNPENPCGGPGFVSLLDFDRWFTFTDITAPFSGSYLLEDYVEDQPSKVFANRASMPDSNYAMAFDSSKNDWEKATSFLYKNSVMLNQENLEQEVFTSPDTGVSFNYASGISHQIVDWNYPQPFPFTPPVVGPPVHTTITINNSFSAFGSIRKAENHERKHRYFYASNSNRENPDPADDDHRPRTYLGKLLKVNRSLQSFFHKGLPRLGVYKEN